jgi:glycosyltransferase involved in cell wall biosynthesis
VPFEAGLAGNPVIATGYSGNMEFMNNSNSFLVDYQETFVSDMSNFNKWYLGCGRFAEPNMINATHWMQYVVSNRQEAKARGERLRSNIINNFSYEAVSDIVIKRISEI